MRDFFHQHLRAVIFYYICALLAASWLLLKRLPEWIRSLRAGKWPASQGRIETADVKTIGDQALAELGYSYLVEGERYSGYYSRQFADAQHAWDYVKGLEGQLVVVRYKEDDPGVSALRSADQQSFVNLKGRGFFSSFWSAVLERLAEFYPRRL